MSGLMAELAVTARQARRAWQFLAARQQRRLLGALCLMLLLGFLAAQVPVTLGQLVDTLSPKRADWGVAATRLEIIGGLLFAIVLLNIARRLIVEDVATTLERDAKIAGTRSLLRASLDQLGKADDAAIGGNLNRSVTGIVKLVKLCFLDALPAITTAFFALAAAMHKHLALGLVMAAVVPISLCIVLWQMASQRGVRHELIDVRNAMDGTLGEQLSGIETVRAAHTIGYELARTTARAEGMRRREFAHHVAMAKFDAGKSIAEGVAYVLVIAFALWLTFAGRITSGDILAFSLLFLGVLSPLREVHRILDEAHESGMHAVRFFEILDTPADISFDCADIPADPDAIEMITTSGLTVSFVPAEAGEIVTALDDVSFTIRAGEVIGIAGPSGAGKSTLVRIALRLVHPSSGRVTVGGTDLAQLSRAEIGRRIGYVSQRPFVFTGTIAENIAYGIEGASEADIVEAARQANIHDEIARLPDGYRYRVNKRGENLSVGQIQRIALARIFLRRPPILILDEATASLDNVNERAVIDAIGRAVAGRTVLIIAHRLTTLERTDRILVFEAGRIAEIGDFATLASKKNGVLARLLRAAAGPGSIAEPASAPPYDEHLETSDR